MRTNPLVVGTELSEASCCELKGEAAQFSKEMLDPLLADKDLQRAVDNLLLRLGPGKNLRLLEELLVNL